MKENSEIALYLEETNAKESSSDESQLTPLLPRPAWSSQLTYLKVLLKAKQTLDKVQININYTVVK